ncbi:protein kinase domain-containing protein [Streptosporangium sandarakinum]
MRVLSGRYELLEPLGRGGMGVVYRARDQELERIVAVKVLPAQMLRDEDFRARFRREARAAAGLSHPNIAAVYDIGEDTDGGEPVPYLVMELVEGGTLADLLRRTPPTPAEAGQIVAAVLEALEHSHERKIVHRDIKPANIMVHRAGDRVRVKVMDFGIAKLMSQTATRLTATGMRIGTPSYMSPEQADGRPADARSDLYSVGCVLYEMLTGRPPFTGDSPAVVLFQHLHKTPQPPSQLNPALALFWDQVLATALAKDPQQRHQDAAAMRQAIETGSAAPTTQVPPTAPPPTFGPPIRLDPPTLDETTSPAPSPRAPGSPGLGERSASGSATDDHVAAVPRQVLTRRRLLAGLGAAGLAATLPTAYYAFTQEDPSTKREDPSTKREDPATLLDPPLSNHHAEVYSVAFSSDGKTLATGSRDRTARLWDVNSSIPTDSPLTGHTKGVNSVAFSPDSKTLATGSGDKTARLWDAATRTPIGRPLTGHTKGVSSVAFSPDGKILATGSGDKTARLWDAATRAPIGRPLTGHTDEVLSVAFSPDGKTLATGSEDGTARLWNVNSSIQIGRPLTGHTKGVTSVAFSPDGKTLATGSEDGTTRLWNVATRAPIDRPLIAYGQVFSVAFSPDGKTLATGSGDKTARLWDAATRAPIGRPLTGHTGEVFSVAFSPDGKTLATGSGDRTVRLWRL